MFFQIKAPLVPCVICVFLQITLQMLATLKILEMECRIVIYSVVVMHDFRITCQQRQHIILQQTFESLLHMRSIERDGFISIEPETCAFRIDEDDSIIPVEKI